MSFSNNAGFKASMSHFGRQAIALAALALFTFTAVAEDKVGRVLFTAGKVVAVDNANDGARDKPRRLSRGDPVRTGETIRTGNSGRTQLRLNDGALIALASESRFRIERYETPDEDAGGRAVLRLLEGGFRTITGAIGEQSEDAYELATPVANIGIRGTKYALRHCRRPCGAAGVKGLFGHVYAGRIQVSNPAGESTFGAGSYFRVSSRQDAPHAIETPPPGLLGSGDDGDAPGTKPGRIEERSPNGDSGFSAGDESGAELESEFEGDKTPGGEEHTEPVYEP